MTITGHLSIVELEERFRSAAEPVKGRHFQAIWLSAKGRTFVEAAEVLAFAPRWVEALAQRYDAIILRSARADGAFSSLDMVGCEPKGSPLSGAPPTARLKAGSSRKAFQFPG